MTASSVSFSREVMGMWIGRAKWDWLKEQNAHLRHCWQVCQDDARHQREAADQAHAHAADLSEELRDLRTREAQSLAAIREAQILRTRLNAIELERATLLTRLLPGLNLTIPQFGRLDVALGPPGTDFDHAPIDDEDIQAGDLPEEIPVKSERNRDTISDEIGELDEPALRTGTVVDTRRPPTE